MSTELTPQQRRRLRTLRFVLLGAVASAVVALLLLGVVLLGGGSRTLALVLGFIVVESMTSAAVLGAFAKCPACGKRLGAAGRGLLPTQCGSCGVELR